MQDLLHKKYKFTTLTKKSGNKIKMKKTIYATAILMCSLATSGLYSQTENKCYSFEKNSNGELETVLVKLVVNGNKVDADYRKDAVIAGSNSHVTMTKQGVIEGDKIVFTSAEKTKINTVETNNDDSWYFKNGSLIIGGDILKPGGCN